MKIHVHLLKLYIEYYGFFSKHAVQVHTNALLIIGASCDNIFKYIVKYVIS